MIEISERKIFAECWDNLTISVRESIIKKVLGERKGLVKIEGNTRELAEADFIGFGDKIQEKIAKEMVKRGLKCF